MSTKGRQDLRRWGLAVLVVAGLGWWLGEPAPQGAMVGLRKTQSWALPELPRWVTSAGTPVLIAQASFWDRGLVAAPVEAAAPVDDRWRFAGVLGAGADRKVLVAFSDQNKPPQLFKLGESLPGGHKITRIDDRSVCVALGKRSYTLAIERLDVSGP